MKIIARSFTLGVGAWFVLLASMTAPKWLTAVCSTDLPLAARLEAVPGVVLAILLCAVGLRLSWFLTRRPNEVFLAVFLYFLHLFSYAIHGGISADKLIRPVMTFGMTLGSIFVATRLRWLAGIQGEPGADARLDVTQIKIPTCSGEAGVPPVFCGVVIGALTTGMLLLGILGERTLTKRDQPAPQRKAAPTLELASKAISRPAPPKVEEPKKRGVTLPIPKAARRGVVIPHPTLGPGFVSIDKKSFIELGERLALAARAGAVTQEEFDRLHMRFFVRDAEGNARTVGLHTGRWVRSDTANWVDEQAPERLFIEESTLELLETYI